MWNREEKPGNLPEYWRMIDETISLTINNVRMTSSNSTDIIESQH